MKKIFSLILFYALLTVNAQNYEAPKENTTVLNAADTPIEYVTGIPDIGVDLFSVPTINPNFSLNLRLQYDLYANSSIQFSTRDFGDTWRLSVLPKITQTITQIDLVIDHTNIVNERYYENEGSHKNQLEGDIFTYDIFGLSGSFTLYRNNTTLSIKTIEQNEYAQININYTFENTESGTKFTINSYTITDKNGFKYLFSTFDYLSVRGIEKIKATDFNISQIYDRHNNLLCEYLYTQTPERISSLASQFIYKNINKINSIKINQLATIEFNKISMTKDEILLKNVENKVLKKIDFNYTQRTINLKKTTEINYRWNKKLLSDLNIWSADVNKKQTYSFEYNVRNLPELTKNSLGFLIKYDACNNNIKAHKEHLYYDHLVLKKIKYPTGGTVFYEFEPNDFALSFDNQTNNAAFFLRQYKENNAENQTLVNLPLVHDPLKNRYLLETPNIPNSDNFVYISYNGNYYPDDLPSLPNSPRPDIFPSLSIHSFLKNANFNTVSGTYSGSATKDQTSCILGPKFSTINSKYTITYNKNHLDAYTFINAKTIVYKTENIQKYIYGHGLRVKRIVTFDQDVNLNAFNNGTYSQTPVSEIELAYRKFDDINTSSGYSKYGMSEASGFRNYTDLILYKNVSVKTKGLGEIQYTFDAPNASFETNSNIFPENSFIKKLPSKIVKKDDLGNTVEENTFTRTFKEFSSIEYNNIYKQPIATYEKITNRTFVNGNSTPLELITESNFDTISRNLTSKKIINSLLGETFEEKYTYVKHNGAYLPKKVDKFKNGVALNRSENFYTSSLCVQNNIVNTYFNLATTQVAKSNLPLEIENEYTRYSCQGKLLEYKTKDGVYVSQIWGYNGAFVIAELHNIRYSEISTAVLPLLISDSNKTDSSYNENNIRTHVNLLRSLHPNAKIKSYTYNPLIGITSMTDVNGINEFYEYDHFNRLYRIKDHNNLILKEYNYNYKNQ